LENNKNAYFADFVTRSPFTGAYPTNLTGQQFVDKLYNNAGIAPASSGHIAPRPSTKVNAAPQIMRPARVRCGWSLKDSMLYQQEFNKAFVLISTSAYLQRKSKRFAGAGPQL